MKTNTQNATILTSRALQYRKALWGAKGVLLALFVGLAVGCDAGGPAGEEEERTFDIDRVQVSFQPTLIHEHPSFEVTIENLLDWGLDEVTVDMSYWTGDTQVANTPMLFTSPIPSRLSARRTFPVITIDPSLITSHEDYDCYRYEVRAEDEKGNYENKVYEGTCS
ncbi:hypothetical protein GGQ19_002561 [Salinibacter ruber]|uniref:DUF2800 domain-containing protein n=1 Tax=Salinibacter ruber TaxID=146919 RepID=UPI002168753C|nr:DUF2800 domain-containing protein [Salinibacter ruber]MCS3751366.1 hypothetical protein [Salinibacter ruber]